MNLMKLSSAELELLQFSHLKTEVSELERDNSDFCSLDGTTHGATVWQARVRPALGAATSMRAAIQWDWVVIPPGALVMADPYKVVSTFWVVNEGEAVTHADMAPLLLRLVNTLDWQKIVLNEIDIHLKHEIERFENLQHRLPRISDLPNQPTFL